MDDDTALQPDERELRGEWIVDSRATTPDSAERRIGRLLESYLEQVAVKPNSGGWEILFRDPRDGRYWELTYPQAEMQGGGPRRLTLVTLSSAEASYLIDGATR